jgi:L-asparagine transporter-like permease
VCVIVTLSPVNVFVKFLKLASFFGLHTFTLIVVGSAIFIIRPKNRTRHVNKTRDEYKMTVRSPYLSLSLFCFLHVLVRLFVYRDNLQ